MSLIFDYLGEYQGQPYHEKKLMRLKYYPNGKSELVQSDGSSLLDTIKHCYEDYYNYSHPFNRLPKWYDKLTNKHATSFIYKLTKYLYSDYKLRVRK